MSYGVPSDPESKPPAKPKQSRSPYPTAAATDSPPGKQRPSSPNSRGFVAFWVIAAIVFIVAPLVYVGVRAAAADNDIMNDEAIDAAVTQMLEPTVPEYSFEEVRHLTLTELEALPIEQRVKGFQVEVTEQRQATYATMQSPQSALIGRQLAVVGIPFGPAAKYTPQDILNAHAIDLYTITDLTGSNTTEGVAHAQQMLTLLYTDPTYSDSYSDPGYEHVSEDNIYNVLGPTVSVQSETTNDQTGARHVKMRPGETFMGRTVTHDAIAIHVWEHDNRSDEYNNAGYKVVLFEHVTSGSLDRWTLTGSWDDWNGTNLQSEFSRIARLAPR